MKLIPRRWWSRLALVAFALFVLMQAVPYGRNHVNPPVGAEPAWDSPDTKALARQACYDCHSNETSWPAYSYIAPASWLVQRDVDNGREKLNFSEWQRPQEEADEAAEKVREGEMPMPIYALMHSHARLSPADRARLAEGLAKTTGGAARDRAGEDGDDAGR